MSDDTYRSSISSRPSYNRTSTHSFGSPGSGNRVLRIVTETSTSSTASGLSPFGQTAASVIRDDREREKKEITELNDRFAGYIEKTRFLEAQNRKLEKDLQVLEEKSGKSSGSVKIIYEVEISNAQSVSKKTSRHAEEAEEEISTLQKQLDEIREKFEEAQRGRFGDRSKIDELLVEFSKLEAEINLLKRRIALLEEEVTRLKKEEKRLHSEQHQVRTSLDQETLISLDHRNTVKTLLDEIEIMKAGFQAELKNLQGEAVRDTTNENRLLFKNELANAMRDLRAEYEQMMNQYKNEKESWYRMSVQEINTQSNRQNVEHNHQKEEAKRLKNLLADLRGKQSDLEIENMRLQRDKENIINQRDDDERFHEEKFKNLQAQIDKENEANIALMLDLQMLLDAKQNLDGEIKVYRKILDKEDDVGLKELIEKVVRTTAINEVAETETMRVVKGEHSSRKSYQKSAKGVVSIEEACPEGKFVVLKNTSKSKEEPLGDWKLKRKIDGKREIVFTFPSDYVLHPSKTVKIFARGHGVANEPDVLVFESEDTFGIGSNVQTILYNSNGEKRATVSQRQSHHSSSAQG